MGLTETLKVALPPSVIGEEEVRAMVTVGSGSSLSFTCTEAEEDDPTLYSALLITVTVTVPFSSSVLSFSVATVCVAEAWLA